MRETHQLFRVPRLGEIGGGAAGQPVFFLNGLAAAGEHDNRNFFGAIVISQNFAQLQTVQLGDAHIQNDKVRAAKGQVPSLFPILRFNHFMLGLLETEAQHFARVGIVLNKQDTGHKDV